MLAEWPPYYFQETNTLFQYWAYLLVARVYSCWIVSFSSRDTKGLQKCHSWARLAGTLGLTAISKGRTTVTALLCLLNSLGLTSHCTFLQCLVHNGLWRDLIRCGPAGGHSCGCRCKCISLCKSPYHHPFPQWSDLSEVENKGLLASCACSCEHRPLGISGRCGGRRSALVCSTL